MLGAILLVAVLKVTCGLLVALTGTQYQYFQLLVTVVCLWAKHTTCYGSYDVCVTGSFLGRVLWQLMLGKSQRSFI